MLGSFLANCADWFGRFFNDPTAVFTFALFAVTLLLFFATRGLVNSAERTAERQLRAYVFVDGIFVADGKQIADHAAKQGIGVPIPKILPNQPGAIWSIKNSGQTPAYKVLHIGAMDVIEVRLEHAITIPNIDSDKSKSSIPPGGANTKTGQYGRALNDWEIEEIRNHMRAIYVFGRLEYIDAFGHKRWTTYKLRYSGIYPPAEGAQFTFCDTGNETDEN